MVSAGYAFRGTWYLLGVRWSDHSCLFSRFLFTLLGFGFFSFFVVLFFLSGQTPQRAC